MFILKEGMALNLHGTIYKVTRVRKNGTVVLKFKGVLKEKPKEDDNERPNNNKH